jgi:hypothetical protein
MMGDAMAARMNHLKPTVFVNSVPELAAARAALVRALKGRRGAHRVLKNGCTGVLPGRALCRAGASAHGHEREPLP